jgi:hypothetical protein
MSEPAPLTHEESLALAGAMFAAAEQGDHEALDRLAKLAKAPDEVRRVLTGQPAD